MSFLLTCPRCLVCPPLAALTCARFKILPLYRGGGGGTRKAGCGSPAGPGWVGDQGNKYLCSAGCCSFCHAAPYSLGNGHWKPLLAQMRGSSRAGSVRQGWAPASRASRATRAWQISGPQPGRVCPLSLDTLCSLQVFTTPAQQPVATPLMTPSYSYTTPSQPITTPQYQLQANTTPQSTQSQTQSQPSSSSRQRQQPK